MTFRETSSPLSRRELLGLAPASLALGTFLQDPALPARTAKTRFAANLEMWWTKLPFLEEP